MKQSSPPFLKALVIFVIISGVAIVGYCLYEIILKIWPIFITIAALIIIWFIKLIIHPSDPNQY